MLRQHQEEIYLSPFVTATHRPPSPASVTPALDAFVLSMKLWVELKSKRAMRRTPLMETRITMVRLACSCMPV
jgi:hypothetical protein